MTATYPFVSANFFDSDFNNIGGILSDQAIVFNSLPSGIYYARMGGYSNISYKLKVDPAFDEVNPQYYYYYDTDVPDVIAEKYKCATNSFMSYDTQPVGNLPNAYEYIIGTYSGYAIDFYSNGFPIINIDCIPHS